MNVSNKNGKVIPRKWAERYIREEVDTEGKFLKSEQYGILGGDLREHLAQVFIQAAEIGRRDLVTAAADVIAAEAVTFKTLLDRKMWEKQRKSAVRQLGKVLDRIRAEEQRGI